MQEEADEKSINLCIASARISAEVLASAMRTWSTRTRAMRKASATKEKRGLQSLKSLTESGAELTQIPIEKSGLADFAKEAKKYHVDYAVVKNRGEGGSPYLIFFKAKNTAQLEAAFGAYSERALKKIEASKTKERDDLTAYKTKDRAADKAGQTIAAQTLETLAPEKKRARELEMSR